MGNGLTQEERRARTRGALLEAAARGISRYGYSGVKLEQVAREAGCTRGALYHQFRDKEDLALAVVDWVNDVWEKEVASILDNGSDPVETLLTGVRAHAVFSRRGTARVLMALMSEFGARDHPIGRGVKEIYERLVKRFTELIEAGRREGSIPPGPPAEAVALAIHGAGEGTVIQLAGMAPWDEILAARAIAGVLGVGETEE